MIKYFNDTLKLLRTKLYCEFEEKFKVSFGEQIKHTTYNIELDFRTFDPLNYYRSIQPLMVEKGKPKSLSETGQGMRNLILMALFRTYAEVFKDNAIIAIEEPEIYLHPHAQRSLATLFNELAKRGKQIFYSSHSGNFIAIEHFDRICLVEQCLDSSGQLCTQLRQVYVEDLLENRQKLHPDISMNPISIRERYSNICGLEHNEALFAKKIVLVEGETEEYSLPIYALKLGYDFDTNGVSIVNAHGKHNLDQFYQLYTAFGIPVYLIFDNDRGGKKNDSEQNVVLLRMLGKPECLVPEAVIEDKFAIIEGNFERAMREYLESIEPGKYKWLENEAKKQLGEKVGKGLMARFMAQKLTNTNKLEDQKHVGMDFLEFVESKKPITAASLKKADRIFLENSVVKIEFHKSSIHSDHISRKEALENLMKLAEEFLVEEISGVEVTFSNIPSFIRDIIRAIKMLENSERSSV